MAAPAVGWDRRAVHSQASHAGKLLYEPEPAVPSVELAHYRTEYRLLGPLEVVHRGSVVDTGGQRKRALLARLFVDANPTGAGDAPGDALWGGRGPGSGPKRGGGFVLHAPQGPPPG